VPWKPELTMHHGFAHGAVVGFLADSACAWAAASLVGDVVTMEYTLNLLAPAVGDALHAEGHVLKTRGHCVVCRADVFALRSGRQERVATARATIARVKRGGSVADGLAQVGVKPVEGRNDRIR
jgi:uncharacterized protein (TIGR00369 family)